MELLVVIAIIMIVSSILIASYFAMTRGSSYTAAEKNVFNALTLARQRACIDGKRVYLLFQNSTDLVIVRSAGKVTSTDYPIGKIFDAYADLSTDISNVKIYNMDARGEATVDSISLDNVQVPNAFDPPPTYTAKQLCFHISSVSPANCFEVGDRYGLAVYQMQQLPKGFYCKVDTESLSSQEPDPLQDNNKVIFEPDGRRGDRSIIKITVIEKIVEGTASGGQNRIVFTISPEGKIKVEPIGT